MSVTLIVTAAASSETREAGAAQTLTFDQPRIVVGRGAHADVRLPSRAVSDTHVVVRLEAGDLSVMDDASTNGTTVNGQPLVRGRKKALRSGDRIGVPGFEITVESSMSTADPPERTMTVARRLLGDALARTGAETAPPELVLITGRRAGQRWKLVRSGIQLIAGRGEMCEIVLDDPDCSRQHASFDREDVGVTVRDLQSKNGIFIAGRRTNERRLRHGDEVQLGRSVLAFSDPADELLRAFELGPDEPPPPKETTGAVRAPPADTGSAVKSPDRSSLSDAAFAPTPGIERNAVTIPPPASTSGAKDSTGHMGSLPQATSSPSATPNGTPSTLEPTSKGPPARRRGHAADWILVILAIVILAVSAAALYVLLHGSATPH